MFQPLLWLYSNAMFPKAKTGSDPEPSLLRLCSLLSYLQTGYSNHPITTIIIIFFHDFCQTSNRPMLYLLDSSFPSYFVVLYVGSFSSDVIFNYRNKDTSTSIDQDK